MAAGLTASQTVLPAPWFCQKKKRQFSDTRQIVLLGHWGGVRALLPRATSDGEGKEACKYELPGLGAAVDPWPEFFDCRDRFTHARLVSGKNNLHLATGSEI